jgi:hypothetical protein
MTNTKTRMHVRQSPTQIDVMQLSTRNSSMTYICPYTEVVLSAGEYFHNAYIRSLLSLYREGINSNSPNYQFLCWYKIVKGVNAKREEESGRLKGPLPLKHTERLEKDNIEQCKRLKEAFPFIKLSRKLSFGLHPEVGNNRLQFLFAFAFHAFRFFTSLVGIGISRSLYAFGVHPLSGLWVTRTIDPARLMSRHSVYITSCSRSPVIRKNSYQSRSSASQTANSLSSSSCS